MAELSVWLQGLIGVAVAMWVIHGVVNGPRICCHCGESDCDDQECRDCCAGDYRAPQVRVIRRKR